MTPGIMAWCDQKMANVRLYNTGYLKWDVRLRQSVVRLVRSNF